MEEEALSQEIRQILKKSHGEPSKLMEFITCVSSMDREGETASYPKIVRRMWPQDWQETEDKVQFEQTKWDLLCKRRREINRRVFSSLMCFQFFIELSPDKKFTILIDPEEVHSKRLKELEWDLAREKSKSSRKKILADIAELNSKFHKLGIKEVQGITERPGDEETDLPGIAKTGRGIWAARKSRVMLALTVALLILAVSITLTYIFSRRSPAVPTPVQPLKLAIPEKPSIAVLPFVNMSDDPKQEFFPDGITEEIITALSRSPHLFVIARNSTFTYKGKPVRVEQVSEELGVRYVLEGSVRREGDTVRITAQLTDALKGHHLWAERYDRELKDIFAIQDDVTMKIMTSILGKTLFSEEEVRVGAKGARNLEAFLKVMEGVSLFLRYTKEDNALALWKLEEAIALDPDWATPYSTLSRVYSLDYVFDQNPESLEKAYEYAQKAISLDETQTMGYLVLELVYSIQRRHEEAIAAGEQAVKVAPGLADAYGVLGEAMNFAGRHKEALAYLEKALRMNPFPPTWYFMHIGHVHFVSRNYEEAVSAYKKGLSISPNNQLVRRGLIATYVEMGRLKEARTAAEELLKIDPKFTIMGYEKIAPWRYPKVTERFAEAYRKAGLE